MRAVVTFSLLASLTAALGVGRSACSKLGGSDAHPSQPSPVSPPAVASAVASTPPAPASASAAPSAVASASAAPSASPSAPIAAAEMRAEDWEGPLGKWHFENGELVCDGKATSSVIFYKPIRAKDFDLSVDFQFEGVESSAGVVFRYQGNDFYNGSTFYQFEWYSHGSHHDKRLSLMKKTYLGPDGPFWIQIVEPKYPEAPINRWIHYRVRAEGERLQTWVDAELAFDKVDKAFVRDGRIALHTFQPRKTRYRDFKVEVLDPK